MLRHELKIQNIPIMPDPRKISTNEGLYSTIRHIAVATKQGNVKSTDIDNRLKHLESISERHWFHDIEVYNKNKSLTLPVRLQQDGDGDTGICMSTETQSYGFGIDNSEDVFKLSPECPLTDKYYFAMNPDGQIRLETGVYIDDFSDDETFADLSDTALVTERAISAFVLANSPWLRDAVNGYIYLNTITDRVGIGTQTPITLLEVWDDNAHPIIAISAEHATDYDPYIKYLTDVPTTVKASHGVDSANDSFKIYMGNGVGGTDQFVIAPSGYLGLGTNDPQAPLHIWRDEPISTSITSHVILQNIDNIGPSFNQGDAYIRYVVGPDVEANRFVAGQNYGGFRIAYNQFYSSPHAPGKSTGFYLDNNSNVTIGIVQGTTNELTRLRLYRSSAHGVGVSAPIVIYDCINTDLYTLYRKNTGLGSVWCCVGLEYHSEGHERFKIVSGDDISLPGHISVRLLNQDVEATDIGNVGFGVDEAISIIEVWDDDAHPIVTITAEHDTDYDPQMQFRTDAVPTVKFSMGVDAADDSFRIFSGSGIGGTTEFVLDTSGNLTMAGTAQFSAIGVGVAPDATTIGKFYRNDASITPMVHIHNASTGDASLWFQDNAQSFTIGLDNGDSLFKIAPGTSLPTSDYFVMNSTGRLGLNTGPLTTYQINTRQDATNITGNGCLNVTMYATSSAPGGYTTDSILVTCRHYGTANNTGYIRGMDMQAVNYATAGTLTEASGGFFGYGTGGIGGTVTNANGLHVELQYNAGTVINSRDIYCATPRWPFGTIGNEWCIYSDHDAPSRLINDLQIASDVYGLKLGSAQDFGLIFNGTDGIIDYDLLNSGTSDYRIQQNGTDRFSILTGTNEVIIEGSGYIRTDTARYRRYYHLALASFNPGASGATWQSADGNQLCGYRLNTDTETLEFGTDTHNDWDAVSDLEIEVKFSINAAGGAPADTVDWQLLVYIKGNGDVATKTQTILASTTINADAQFTKYTQEFTIDYDDVGDPVDIGDDLCFVLTCEATGDVTDVRITGASYNYHTTHLGIESGDT